jgi:Mg-chelatase subunit ChlD
MRLLKIVFLICVVVMLLALAAGAQTSGCWFPLTVEVVGAKPSLQKVSAKNLELRIGGKAVSPSAISSRTVSEGIILLDTSASMKTEGFSSLLVLTKDLITGLPPSVQKVGLTAFSRAAIQADGKQDSLRVLEELERRGPQGQTKLLDSMLRSLSYFHAGSETVMFVISDGGDNRSRKSRT